MSTPAPKTGRCDRCNQPRPLFPYTYLSPDSRRKETVALCVRCHGIASSTSARQLDEDLFMAIGGSS